ncbi:conserved hypothetical protein [Renibacterium salmoninarum ATCC 33209]|uniref:Integral membrane protein n=1 Tax=Renibacterium salmoninarum (strain ATCC 33209 / DSM 20767 / JCM 11484 / NBRC 15589 / NCIMB 2235) TaxID=288705 RepID=A9WPF8_RENSM|nr:DUF1003 domain-containing protein [Renibacterium salmoninarum]ABY22933.1 conserved hypothetical protein [Renibacterium salmoninarum ATCC 33209]
MAEKYSDKRQNSGLDTPLELRSRLFPRFSPDPDSFGRLTEGFARFMGTPQFLLYMTLFCAAWLGWNTLAPEELQFDPRALNFTLLTLILSLQASYAAPLLLLAQNRQDDRDRVAIEQDRQTAARNLADTEYLTRELASLRIALREVATRDFVRSELKSLLEDLLSANESEESERPREKSRDSKGSPKTQALPKVKKKTVTEKPLDSSEPPAAPAS